MANTLLSGPAGGSKSQEARRRLREHSNLAVVADFQSIYAALTQAQRDPETGRYPLREDRLLPLTEYVRRAVVTGAVARDLGVIITNSDGDPDRRAFLLSQLGPDAQEIIVDPGESVIRARLSDPATGVLSFECNKAVGRWYGRYKKR